LGRRPNPVDKGSTLVQQRTGTTPRGTDDALRAGASVPSSNSNSNSCGDSSGRGGSSDHCSSVFSANGSGSVGNCDTRQQHSRRQRQLTRWRAKVAAAATAAGAAAGAAAAATAAATAAAAASTAAGAATAVATATAASAAASPQQLQQQQQMQLLD
jgi:3-oxoacyl-ACP reductase-like protein